MIFVTYLFIAIVILIVRAKVVKDWRSHNRNDGAGGILKRYAADSERVMR